MSGWHLHRHHRDQQFLIDTTNTGWTFSWPRTVAGAYQACDRDDAKNLVRLSTEWRLLDAAVARLLKHVETDAPQPMSQRSAKGQQVARARWDRASSSS
jgi:hypothetical protein